MVSPIMATHADSRSFVEACLFLTLLVAVQAAPQEVCDKTKCSGPLHLYEELDCTPVYKNPGDCCADRYNCSHLKEPSKDKCYANGHGYSLGEILRPEDRNRCDLSCTCVKPTGYDFSAFRCGVNICQGLPKDYLPYCYYRNSHDNCCPELHYCLEPGEGRSSCEVDGKIYWDGESFELKSDREKHCICMPGYKGENVEPFCKKQNRKHCDPLFNNPIDIYKHCAPVFFDYQDPRTNCSTSFRCQNEYDIVIHKHDSTKSPLKTDEDDMCRLGDLTMHRGDELNQGTDYSSICIKCVCEVPPMPTCQEVSRKECWLTKQERFDDKSEHRFGPVGVLPTIVTAA